MVESFVSLQLEEKKKASVKVDYTPQTWVLHKSWHKSRDDYTENRILFGDVSAIYSSWKTKCSLW